MTLAFSIENAGGGRIFHSFNNIISVDNLFISWQEFLKGKRKRIDVNLFSLNLMDNIYSLYNDLKNKTYKHGGYEAFKVNDPKPRDIHKASVRDRLVHHAIYRILYPYFDQKFIYDSYSCRVGKGIHKALNRFTYFANKVSKNNTKQCFILKCDIRKFFASIDHTTLKEILSKNIEDQDILSLLNQIIDSFCARPCLTQKRGLPLGNLTSQLLVNIYMNEFDQFMKHKLKVKYYIRYADDFVILSQDKKYLENVLIKIKEFLEDKLRLELHPDKVFIKTLASGLDFLGWVHFSKHRVLRTVTKRRMFRNILVKRGKKEVVQAYLGLLKYGNSFKLQNKLPLA